jgi:hypothetical protein
VGGHQRAPRKRHRAPAWSRQRQVTANVIAQWKETMHMKKLVLLVSLVTAAAAVSATSASANYGNTAIREIELSANIAGREGGGAWLWIELASNHTGDYSGADCGHGGAGAVSDKGDVEWERVGPEGETLVIKGVVLKGLGGFGTTVTVPYATGHYKGTLGTFLTLPFPPEVLELGTSQLQVAP